MTYADAFLQDILEHPDDDAPRLIFADWLEEQGDADSVARAEFIRVQCHLAKRRSPALELRQEELLDTYGPIWARPMRGLAECWRFHRGFIDSVTLRLVPFVRRADTLFQRAPVRHLALRHRPRSLAESDIPPVRLWENVCLRRLLSLDLRDIGLDSTAVKALAVSEHLTQLTSLNLAGNRIGDAGVRALASAPFFRHLENLDLSRNVISLGGVRQLISSLEELAVTPQGLNLRQLAYGGNRHESSARRLVAASPLLRKVVRW